MSLLMPRIAARIFNTPLMVSPEKAVAMLVGLGARIVEGGVILPPGIEASSHVAFGNSARLGIVGDQMAANLEARRINPYAVVDNIAVIPVEGSLVQKGAYIGQSSGETSFQGLQVQIARATKDPAIKGVVFEIDSCGGEVSGAFETAQAIADLSAVKPTMAILTDKALSCGYLMAAPSRKIVMPATGSAGSIGVISMHIDASGKMEKDGMVVTMIASGAYKTQGNPFQPLDPSLRDEIQARNDGYRQTFAEAVGRGRGAKLNKAAAMSTEAKTFYGKDAVDAGLVDAIAPAQAAFDAFRAAVNRT